MKKIKTFFDNRRKRRYLRTLLKTFFLVTNEYAIKLQRMKTLELTRIRCITISEAAKHYLGIHESVEKDYKAEDENIDSLFKELNLKPSEKDSFIKELDFLMSKNVCTLEQRFYTLTKVALHDLIYIMIFYPFAVKLASMEDFIKRMLFDDLSSNVITAVLEESIENVKYWTAQVK